MNVFSVDECQVQLHRGIFRSSREDEIREEQVPCDWHWLLSPSAGRVWHKAARTQFTMWTEHNGGFVPHTDNSLRS